MTLLQDVIASNWSNCDSKTNDFICSVIELLEKDILVLRETLNHAPVIGFSAVQGTGKSTILKIFSEYFRLKGDESKPNEIIILSVDNFYYPAQKLAELSNLGELYAYRGNIGTYDLDLLNETLKGMIHFVKSTKKSTSEFVLPFFDKALLDGKGDRAGNTTIQITNADVACIIVEGWNISHTALGISCQDKSLQLINS